MFRKTLYTVFVTMLTACSQTAWHTDEETAGQPGIFPDYAGCTIPPNIAPLNFSLTSGFKDARVRFSAAGIQWVVKAAKGQFTLSPARWEKLLAAAKGGEIKVEVAVKKDKKWIGYAPSVLRVANEPVDPYIAYRLIEPGYEVWNQMGIYQRCLEDYKESPIMENKLSDGNCMNCHSFRMQDPEQMIFHMRGGVSGTLLMNGGKTEKLNTKTDKTISALVYPSWHPSGRYIAFSTNNTKQAFHMNNPNRVEVYDEASDVVVYDVEKHEIITHSAISGEHAFENFPTFSPDGKTLYFCTSAPYEMPDGFDKVKYSICSIAFDAENRKFGSEVDTIYNAGTGGLSASFPRVSPDGRFLLYTLSDYGGFNIWHKDSDLYMFDIRSGKHYPLDTANSPDSESYHSWSSNSRWIIFSSRRMDGLYTRLFISYIDDEGQAHKPFVIPQKETGFYHRFMKSYNVPEFITGKVKDNRRRFSAMAKETGTDVTFAGKE